MIYVALCLSQRPTLVKMLIVSSNLPSSKHGYTESYVEKIYFFSTIENGNPVVITFNSYYSYYSFLSLLYVIFF